MIDKSTTDTINVDIPVKWKVKFTLEQAIKAQRGVEV
jgi:hypothetical protein